MKTLFCFEIVDLINYSLKILVNQIKISKNTKNISVMKKKAKFFYESRKMITSIPNYTDILITTECSIIEELLFDRKFRSDIEEYRKKYKVT